MPRTDNSLRQLDAALSSLSDPNERAAELVSFLARLDIADPPATRAHRATGGNTAGAPSLSGLPFDEHGLNRLVVRHGISPSVYCTALGRQDGRPEVILDEAPCAFVNPATRDECLKAGSRVCGGCRLVKYCSKRCQKKHWQLHARDCKDPIRSQDWQPAWVEPDGVRVPLFATGLVGMHPLSHGLPLWGRNPAMDILNLPADVAATNPDINLAFIASGDLRNVVRTVNGLPADYAGKLTILLNDEDDYITARNIILLQLLANILDKRKAADVALHFWYSAFIPEEYHTEILAVTSALATGGTARVSTKLGARAQLESEISQDMRMLCLATILCTDLYGTADAADELTSVRFHPLRHDLHHHRYVRCEPAHRLALLKYRRCGLVLPFGAHNARFNTPNRFLFSPDGRWLQSDTADPLDCWDIEEVVASGKAHGTTREDLYGCLYFHVSDQLRAFADRLARYDVSFTISTADPTELAPLIRLGMLADIGVPATIRFDRIDAASFADRNREGAADVLGAWGRFLRNDTQATLLAQFVDWPMFAEGGFPAGEALDEATREAFAAGRIPVPNPRELRDPRAHRDAFAKMIAYSDVPCAVHDGSAAFDQHLEKQGLSAALRRAGLQRRTEHIIVPHRHCARLGAAPSALPEFTDEESWYLQSNIGSATWTERCIEVCRAGPEDTPAAAGPTTSDEGSCRIA
ncbi:zf-MYND and DUF4470 domain-containing protein [Phanerochaete sordida]|uniref:Zf-MYND and DUF4470 domain-containing protein n=1 Tax=Phanerochaete sordida TaxID=48140 RepID=A0A9P3GFT3_9APHY|nr:zf-MYND and DUF4470 domain-containing protein [Phanerochaete sordida]